ncbi:carbohydrate-binding protein [candidate division KSB1 bacterium]|nr:carbohydrate-binding protein [candidate division KSB1 bacterium]
MRSMFRIMFVLTTLLSTIVISPAIFPKILYGASDKIFNKHETTFVNKTRGRVTILNGTVVTDRGTLLRGCRVSTDFDEQLPPRSSVTAIKQSGLNTIHLYAESFVEHVPGELHVLVDSLVSWTGQDSLYLVLTIGCMDQNGDYNYDFAMGFWNYYAPRYAEKTHVLYEIHNEPFAWSPPYPDSTLKMERDVYSLIRCYAPDTHVLLFSYACPTNSEGIFQDIQNLGNEIDWTNCSIATHGYGVEYYELENVFQDVRDAGYSIMNTEPCYLDINDNSSINLFRQLTRVHENNYVSYLHFLDVSEIQNPNKFKTIIENVGIDWEPDFGNWPPPAVRDAFSRIDAEYYNRQGGPSGVIDLGDKIGYISNGDYVVYNTVDFNEGAVEFKVKTASGGIGGFVEIHLDSLTGHIAGQVEIQPTGGWDIWTEKTCPVSGVSDRHQLVLKFTGGEWDLFDIDWFRFTPVTTAINKNSEANSLPEKNKLVQNYPNPFNSSTVIRYELSEPGFVILKIFDTLGREIRTLVNKYQQAGRYSISFKPDNIPSGIYFIQLQSAKNYIDVRKMVMMR